MSGFQEHKHFVCLMLSYVKGRADIACPNNIPLTRICMYISIYIMGLDQTQLAHKMPFICLYKSTCVQICDYALAWLQVHMCVNIRPYKYIPRFLQNGKRSRHGAYNMLLGCEVGVDVVHAFWKRHQNERKLSPVIRAVTTFTDDSTHDLFLRDVQFAAYC